MSRLFVLIYAASGGAALIYEVTWTRLLTLQMGHTVGAASTVLAAFMGGLALGAWIAGRLHRVNPLRAYAALETLVALAALALPALLAWSVPALAWAYADGAAPARFALVRVGLSLTLLLLPSAAMGATFPLAARWFAGAARQRATVHRKTDTTSGAGGGSDAAADAGLLYSANTAGAAAGALTAGFWLIPTLGLRGTTWTGVALNLFAAAGALWVSIRHATTGPGADASDRSAHAPRDEHNAALRSRRRPRSVPSVPRRPPSAPEPTLAWTAAAISGFVALVYEVAWTRLLALVIGPTTYAFATMVAAFVLGLACGSAAAARLARRARHPASWLAATLVLAAGTAPAAAWFAASRLPLVIASQVADPGAAFGPIVLREALIVTLLLLPTTVALGAAFPLALATASAGTATVGRDVARVYTSNTLGAIAGALAGGFALLPAFGLQTTFRVVAMGGLAAGVSVWTIAAARQTARAHATASPSEIRRRWTPLATAANGAFGAIATAAVVVNVLVWPRWDHALLASGAYKYAPYLNPDAGNLETTLRAGTLEYYKEGAAATVSVRRLTGTLSLAIDGKIDASNAGDMLTQRLLGLLPVLLHRGPHDVCIIGLGSGVTVDAAFGVDSVRRVDVVEISPEVVEAAAWFERENGGILHDPRVRLIVGDGRSHLRLTSRRYDVIVSEPSNPWMAGVAALFTREFFEAARARLTPDGLLCQWAHTYDISDRDLRSIVRTFASVFPEGTIWLVGDGDLLLIGSAVAAIEPALHDVVAHAQQSRAAALISDLTASIRVSWTTGSTISAPSFELLSLYAGGPRELARYGDAAPIQTDDRMALEFSAPQAIYGRSANDNAAVIRALSETASRPPAIRAAFESATDVSWVARGMLDLQADAYGSAYDDFSRALTLNGQHVLALRGLSEAAAGAGRQDAARALLQSLAAAQPANAAVRVELSRVLASRGDFDGAMAAAHEAVRLAPNDPEPAEQVASIYADAGDAARLTPLAETLLARFPSRDAGAFYHATALFMTGREADAAEELGRLVAKNPSHARAQNLLGAACATIGRTACARAAFEASVAVNPRDPAAYVNLGLFHLNGGDPSRAAGYFAEALTIDPTSAGARAGLAQAQQKR